MLMGEVQGELDALLQRDVVGLFGNGFFMLQSGQGNLLTRFDVHLGVESAFLEVKIYVLLNIHCHVLSPTLVKL